MGSGPKLVSAPDNWSKVSFDIRNIPETCFGNWGIAETIFVGWGVAETWLWAIVGHENGRSPYTLGVRATLNHCFI